MPAISNMSRMERNHILAQSERGLVRCMNPLLAQSGHANCALKCLLSGVKQKSM
jgi:hypothetical protein